MIDLHQGISGEELRELRPGLGSVALAELDVLSALGRGKFFLALRKQLAALQLVGLAVIDTIGRIRR